MASLERIYTYNAREVQESIDHLNIEILQKLHSALCTKFIENFPQFAGRRPTHRQVKKTIIPDIFHLGYAIVCGQPSKDTEKLFSKDNQSLDSAVELENLLGVLTDLSKRVQSLEKEMKSVKLENSKLKQLIESQNEAHPTDPLNSTVIPAHNSTGDKTFCLDNTLYLSTTSHSSSGSSEDTESSDDSEPSSFQPPPQYVRKLRKLENKVKKLSNKKKASDYETEKSKVPLPGPPKVANKNKNVNKNQLRASKHQKSTVTDHANNREVYIGGISHDNSASDLGNFLSDEGVTIISISPLCQRPEQLSFKVVLSSGDYNKVLHDVDWPNGIRVRPFTKNRNKFRQPTNRRPIQNHSND